MTHPSLERLEKDLSESREALKRLVRVSRGLKMTHPSLERLENDSSNKIRPHPSLERLENDLSES